MPVLSAARQRGSSIGLLQRERHCARSWATPPPHPTPANRYVRKGRRAAKALTRHVERGLPTTPPSPTSPSAGGGINLLQGRCHKASAALSDHVLPCTIAGGIDLLQGRCHKASAALSDHVLPCTLSDHVLPCTLSDHVLPCTLSDHVLPCTIAAHPSKQGALAASAPS
eukprot:365130-Chlamydomonas_euryale.AAC.30